MKYLFKWFTCFWICIDIVPYCENRPKTSDDWCYTSFKLDGYTVKSSDLIHRNILLFVSLSVQYLLKLEYHDFYDQSFLPTNKTTESQREKSKTVFLLEIDQKFFQTIQPTTSNECMQLNKLIDNRYLSMVSCTFRL